jgi:hypothetical protein
MTAVPEITIEMPALDSYDELASVAAVADAEDMPMAANAGTAYGMEVMAKACAGGAA